MRSLSTVVVALVFGACTGVALGPDPSDAGNATGDGGPSADGGAGTDAAVDAGVDDAGEFDAGADGGADAGVDAGVDAGLDAGVDAGVIDGGPYGLASRPANPTCVAPARPVLPSGVSLQRAFTGLTFSQPLLMVQAPADAARIFVVERTGRVRVFPNQANATSAQVTTVLDVSTRINTAGEGGLLGAAFPPTWQTNKVIYLSYTESGVNGNPLRSVISRFRSNDNGLTFDPASEEVIFKLDQPFDNHDGGNINFGPDGYLYIGFGDGGSGGDPLGSGQRLNTLLGKMLRIDVNVPFSQRYAIPPTNPFASSMPCNLMSNAATNPNVAKCAEIYAWGLRNPWRWSFDQGSGDLWVGDVGQNAYEEVDRVALGGNYGWNVREGFHCYNASTCATAGFIDPIVEYDHSVGQSITGGYVYRGTAVPALLGRFVFGDYQTGRIWAIKEDPGTGASSMEQLVDSNINPASFGQTLNGEVYALDISGGGIWQLVANGTPPVDTFPKTLSATGCFEPTDPTKPVAAMIPYDVNSPLWSDGAQKLRHFAIPDGSKIVVGADGDFDLPNGSVVAKTFVVGGKRVETRLLMRHSDGVWAGYSYEWNDAQTDATLLVAGQTKQVAGQSWTWPSRGQCLACHTQVAGRTLGLEAAQLNKLLTYPSTGLTRNQLTTLEGVGFFSAPLGAAAQLFLEPPFGQGALESRARSYLHSNCSICHRLNAGQGPQDLRASITFKAMNVCNVAPTNGNQGLTNPSLLVPGDPSRSMLSYRPKTAGAPRMPPLGTAIIDAQGTALIDQWITSVASCPP